MPLPATPPSPLQEIAVLCGGICALLEREHSVLRKSNGLIGEGIPELEALHREKESQIERLDLLSRSEDAIGAARAQPDEARHVREQIMHCKQLQSRNHQVFSRVVAAQRRIIAVLLQPDEEVSLYDRAGRARDFGVTRPAGTA